jgi:hypothetical protein
MRKAARSAARCQEATSRSISVPKNGESNSTVRSALSGSYAATFSCQQQSAVAVSSARLPPPPPPTPAGSWCGCLHQRMPGARPTHPNPAAADTAVQIFTATRPIQPGKGLAGSCKTLSAPEPLRDHTPVKLKHCQQKQHQHQHNAPIPTPAEQKPTLDNTQKDAETQHSSPHCHNSLPAAADTSMRTAAATATTVAVHNPSTLS